MKLRTLAFGSIVAGTAALATAAYAIGPGGQGWHAKGGPGGGMSFQQLDADGNGEVTADEFAAHRQAEFAAADTNGDGKLDRDELTARMQQQMADRVGRMIERFDADADGALAADEMPGGKMQARAGMFERFDTDNSGGLSEQELAAAREHRRGGMKHRRHGTGN